MRLATVVLTYLLAYLLFNFSVFPVLYTLSHYVLPRGTSIVQGGPKNRTVVTPVYVDIE